MPEVNILPKRIRRCEVTNLILTEETAEIRNALRAIYESILIICRRLPPTSLGADPVDALMLPAWYQNPKTGNVLPPPRDLDLSKPRLGTYNFRVNLLKPLELAELNQAQKRICELLETLQKREKAREAEIAAKDERTR